MLRACFVTIACLVTGCASLPDVKMTYYPTLWETTIVVTQTVACDAKKEKLIALSTPSVTTRYFSDLEHPRSLQIAELSNAVADSEFAVAFTDDGRLKSINQSTTGEGEAIVKAAISAGAAVFSTLALERRAPPSPRCDEIEKWGGGKPITITYRKAIGPAAVDKEVTLDVAPESHALYEMLANSLSLPTSRIGPIKKMESGASYAGKSPEVVWLEVQDMAEVVVKTVALGADLGSALVIIPLAESHMLPIPKPALFGKQTFNIAFTDAGAIASIGYTRASGVAAGLNALNSIATIGIAKENAQTAELKARADLIAQQQRVVLCESKPDQCK
jgi:hypothetical protein